MKWKNKIYDHEVTPPEHIWGKISHDLDNGDFVVFKEKLFHAGETPPGDAWEQISRNLDNEPFVVFKDKLFHREVMPPADAWQHIQEQLSGAKVVPIRRGRLLVRVMAAAALVGIMFFAVNRLMVGNGQLETAVSGRSHTSPGESVRSEHGGHSDAVKAITDSQEQVAGAPYTTIIADNSAASRSRVDGTPETEHTSSFTYREVEKAAPVATTATPFTDRMDLSAGISRKLRNQYGEIKEDVSLLDLPNSYFMTTGPNGQSVRVSSKFRNTIQYLNAEGKEEPLDIILRESRYWKSVFSTWKNKVGHSSFVPAIDNFMDIAELMNLIREEEGK